MGSQVEFETGDKRWKYINIVLSIIQMTCFSAAFIILMYYSITTSNNANSYLCSYREVALVSVALFIKLIRMIPIKKAPRNIALSQIKFYTPYLLTIMQCVFKYFSQPHQHATEVPINLFLIFLILKNIYYSFLTHEKLTSFVQAVVASLSLVAWVTLGVYVLMTSVYQFDNQVENDYKKDLVLLFLTTLIANGAMMMDLIFRPVEELIKEKEEEEEEKQNQEKEHLNNKQDCPHCHNQIPSNQEPKSKKPTIHHSTANQRSQTQSPFNTGYRQSTKDQQKSKDQRKSAMNQPSKPQKKKREELSINQELSGSNSKRMSVDMNDTGREIELNLIDKQEQPRRSKLY